MEQEPVTVSSLPRFGSGGLLAPAPRFADLRTGEAGCIHELFEAQVDRGGDEIALISPDRTLSYAELEAEANRLARHLRMHGVRAGSFVGLYMERSRSPIIAILGCLKAGAAYVPIDPAYPTDRIRLILEETEAKVVLSEGTLAARVPEFFDGPLIDVGREAETIASQSSTRLRRSETGLSPSDLAYLIYTSGTTGKPKGVMAEHRHVYRFALAFNEVCATGRGDRVYQGFSLGFDGSVEEMWMAFSNGSALVVGGPGTPRFGDELAQFLTAQGVTYLSTVPTLLSTMHSGIPSLTTLVVSGEVCPPELVSRWVRPGLRMLNVYGPTEATVNTTCAECQPGQPITIGKPLPGYDLYILDESGRPVPEGERGELYVAGQTLARGYFRRPDLTAERFVELTGLLPAESGAVKPLRLYRTGDLVRWGGDGNLEFFGRIDSQVKIRGYRVELAEIESVLLEHPQIRSASVKLHSREGLQELAAYVLLRDGQGELDRGSVLAMLEARLPPYMIPGHLDVLPELPMLASGKVDRARLPAPVAALVRVHAHIVPPEGALEGVVAAVFARVFGVPRVSVEDDFFHDLGGHSLIAAQMVTQLRAELAGRLRRGVTVRDAYAYPTVRKLAAYLAPQLQESPTSEAEAADSQSPGSVSSFGLSRAETSQQVFAAQSPWVRTSTALLQLASTYLIYGLVSLPFLVFFLAARGWLFGDVSTGTLVAVMLGLSALSWPVFMVVAIGAKWLFIGRYKAGSYPLWGFYHFRLWLVGRLTALSGAGALVGTPLLPIYLRLLGARIGRGCTFDTALFGAWDLLSIGDDTSIGADTQALGYRVDGGRIHIGPVRIGSYCFIGNHACLGLHTQLGDHARLDDQSLLPDGHHIPAGEAWRGAPATPGAVHISADAIGPETRRRPVLYGFLHLILVEVLALFSLIPFLPFAFALWAAWLWLRDTPALGIGLWLLTAGPLGVVIACGYIALLKKIVLPRMQPGIYPVHSPTYLRKWLSDGIMRSSRAVLLPLYTTLYLPPYLRLLGAKIGPRAELSSVWYFAPELVEVAGESFFADGSIVGGKRLFRGRFEVGKNRIGRRSFVGNSAILPTGTGLGDRCLLGVNSIPPVTPSAHGDCTRDGSEWLGSPAFALPRRPVVGNFDESVTFHPTRKLYLQRALIDGLRILIPSYIGLGTGIAGLLLLNAAYVRYGLLGLGALAPIITLGLALLATLLVVALKWAVMGRFRPVIKPLWSPYVWLNEMVNGAYESVMAPAIAPFLGTPFMAAFLRLLGCRIGRGCYIETTLFSEFDLVQIGDYAALNFGAVIQNHLFEDRVMKSSYLHIGDSCAVGNMAVVLYDSEMAGGAVLGPLSLLMKGESLAAGSTWHGIPCTPALPPGPEPPLALPAAAALPAELAAAS